MKKLKKYTIYDWENDKFIEVSKKKFLKYQKLKAEIHLIMFPPKAKAS